jgi:hypothetical protein
LTALGTSLLGSFPAGLLGFGVCLGLGLGQLDERTSELLEVWRITADAAHPQASFLPLLPPVGSVGVGHGFVPSFLLVRLLPCLLLTVAWAR